MENDNLYDRDNVAERTQNAGPLGGIYALPMIGNAAAGVRQFYDAMAAQKTDSTEVRIAKEVFRWSSAAAGAAAIAVMVL